MCPIVHLKKGTYALILDDKIQCIRDNYYSPTTMQKDNLREVIKLGTPNVEGRRRIDEKYHNYTKKFKLFIVEEAKRLGNDRAVQRLWDVPNENISKWRRTEDKIRKLP